MFLGSLQSIHHSRCILRTSCWQGPDLCSGIPKGKGSLIGGQGHYIEQMNLVKTTPCYPCNTDIGKPQSQWVWSVLQGSREDAPVHTCEGESVVLMLGVRSRGSRPPWTVWITLMLILFPGMPSRAGRTGTAGS